MEWLRRIAARDVTHLWHLIASPTVWAAHFLFSYISASVGCARLGSGAMPSIRDGIMAATVVALLLVLFFGALAWVQSRSGDDLPPYDDNTTEHRVRFLATAKLMLSGLSFIAIVFQALPVLVFTDCR